MSYYADVRNKYNQTPFKPDSKEPNGYYEEFLSEKDKRLIEGFDLCIEMLKSCEYPKKEKKKQRILNDLEYNRNSIIIGLLDEMDDKEYAENYKKVWGEYPDGRQRTE